MGRKGLTLVELLVAASILGVLLAVAFQLTFGTQRIADRQSLQGRALEDARLAALRLSDVVAQAAYIYPLGQVILLPGGTTITTGGNALALLLPPGTPYCPSAQGYCAFLYSLEGRGAYAQFLPHLPEGSDLVLVEAQYRGFTWPADTVPSRDWGSLSLWSKGVLADAVDRGRTDLSGLRFAGMTSPVDKGLHIPSVNPNVTIGSQNALIGGLKARVALDYGRGVRALYEVEVFARGIPRGLPPRE